MNLLLSVGPHGVRPSGIAQGYTRRRGCVHPFDRSPQQITSFRSRALEKKTLRTERSQDRKTKGNDQSRRELLCHQVCQYLALTPFCFPKSLR
jgi:hypothetical protein